MKKTVLVRNLVFCLVVLLIISSCTLNRTREDLLLAEKMVKKEKYPAAVHIYNKIAEKQPFSIEGQQALYNAATVYEMYLNNPKEAEQVYRLLLKRTKNKDLQEKTYKKLANLYLRVFRDYEKSIEAYTKLLEQNNNPEKAAEYSYLIGRSYFLASSFQNAIKIFEQVVERYPNSEYAKKANLQIGNSFSSMSDCKSAESHYKTVMNYADSYLVNMATFGLATCYEEMDQLDEAYRLFSSIEETYPNKDVIQLKLRKIKRRRILRRR